jgi:hypothetical protein
MPVAATGMSRGFAVPFMVAAGLVFEIIAAFCSSPQTAELNAAQRSATVMKWVKAGIGVSAVFVGIAAYAEPGDMKAIMAGGALSGGVLGAAYVYANNAGLASGQPGTETY